MVRRGRTQGERKDKIPARKAIGMLMSFIVHSFLQVYGTAHSEVSPFIFSMA